MNLFSFIEKRKQIQVSLVFNFLSSSLSYFDFSSFELLENFQHFNILQKKNSATDILLLICFFTQNDNYFVDKSLKKFLIKYNKLTLEKPFQISLFEKIFLNKNYKISKKNFSNELKLFYKQSVNNAYLKYKSPIITSEIFLLTSITDNPILFKNLLKFFIKNKRQWFILKYKLIKHIYFENHYLNLYVKKNLWNYSYLLDKYNTKKKINNFLKNSNKFNLQQNLEIIKRVFGVKNKSYIFIKETESILNLRSLIFSFLLKLNFQQILEDDILLNQKEFSERKYKTQFNKIKN